jgi:two-component system response regulator YesN
MDSEKSYGSSSSYEIRNIQDSIYLLNQVDPTKLTQMIKGEKKGGALSVQSVEYFRGDWNEKKLFPVFESVPLNSLHPYGTLFFLIYPDEIFKEVNLFLDMNEGAISITDRSGKVLYSYDRRDLTRSGENWKELFFISHGNGWNYTWTLPAHSGFEEVKILQRHFILGIILSLSISLGIIFLLMRLNYRPLIIIKQNLEKRLQKDMRETLGIEGLNRMIQFLLDKNSSLEDIVHNSAGLFKEKLLREIIHGEIDDDVINQICLRIGESLEYRNYQAALLFPFSNKGVKQDWSGTCQKYIEDNFINPSFSWEYFGVFGCLSYENSLILFLTDVDEESSGDTPLRDFLKELEEMVGFPLVCGLGSVYFDRRDYFLSYREAFSAVKERIYHNNQVILKHSDLLEYSESAEWSNIARKRKLDELRGSILVGNVQSWESSMQSLISNITMYTGPLSILRHFLINLYEYSETALPDIFRQNSDLPSLADLNQINCADEIVQNLTTLKEKVSSLLIKGKDNDLVEGVKQIIEQNYSDPNLSVEEIARILGVSYSYLSRTFKRRAGMGISDSLIRYRIERFKVLAEDRDESINSLIVKIGYRGTYQFGRIFKKNEGLSPSEYRKLRISQKKLTQTKKV